jgi:hypothetical protein
MRPPAPTAAGLPDRQDQGVLGVYGITFGQSVGRHLVDASTVKLEHLNGTTGDVDAGAMANLGHLRLGIAVRNLREATFDDAAGAVTLTREARAGAAFVGRTAGVVSAIALAADADLTTVQTGAGEARHAGGGFELWVLGGRVGIRGGGAVNTVTDGGSSRSFGASVVIQSGAYLRTLLEAQITGGSDATRRGWSAGLRTTF